MEMKFINFYCQPCRNDWQLQAVKRWLNSNVGDAWQSRCPYCHRKLVRLRDVEAGRDPYFRKSRFVKMQLRKHVDNLVQPGDPRFDLLYPQHKREREEREEQEARLRWGGNSSSSWNH